MEEIRLGEKYFCIIFSFNVKPITQNNTDLIKKYNYDFILCKEIAGGKCVFLQSHLDDLREDSTLHIASCIEKPNKNVNLIIGDERCMKNIMNKLEMNTEFIYDKNYCDVDLTPILHSLNDLMNTNEICHGNYIINTEINIRRIVNYLLIE